MGETNPIRRLAENIPFLNRSYDHIGDGEVPLDTLEEAGFLSGRPNESRWGALAAHSLWPPKNLSQMPSKKLIPIVASGSIIVILFMFWLRGSNRLFMPPESAALAAKLAKELAKTPIPPYVLEYAPLVVLDTREKFFPSDLLEHVRHTHPALNFTPISNTPNPLTLSNLDVLNDIGGKEVFLTLNEDSKITSNPQFLEGDRPNSKTLKTKGTSCAVIVRDHEDGILDAFYMYFYSFNQGPTVFFREIGDHVGDWEHNMVRFNNGVPTAVWYSQHNFGEAYTYEAVQKLGKRPISYSAKGSHANYAVAGKHDLSHLEPRIPAHLVFDDTSVGSLWDPTLSAFYYLYDSNTNVFTAARSGDPENHLYFRGQWGDMQYPDDNPIQMAYDYGYHKFTSGPDGPQFKHLGREDVCLDDSRQCVVLTSL